MKKLSVRLRRSPADITIVGQLAEAKSGIFFEYDSIFLDGKAQLSPFKLPLRSGLIEHVDRSFGPLPGLFDDSLPDGWGLLLMDRMFRRRGIDPATVSPLERLSYLGTRTMGALTYHPPAEVEHDDRSIDLHELGKNAREVFSGEAVDVLPALLCAGGSPGGARPKALIGVRGNHIISGEDDLPKGFEHWMVKFPAKREARDAAPMEQAYAAMARSAGIDMPETRLFPVARGQAYFGVRRFDRETGNRRFHVHTFGNLVHANFRTPSTDYADLIKVTLALTRSHADLLRAFRRMTFNIAAHVRDDHSKNFAFMMNDAGEWSLSPAYDLSYAFGPGGEHTMAVLGEGRAPAREHVLRMAAQFDVKPAESASILEQVNDTVAKWPQFASEATCTKKTAKAIQSHLRSL